MRSAAILLLLAAVAPSQAVLGDDLVLGASRRFEGGRAFVRDAGDDGVIRVRGEEIVIDGGGLELRGAPEGADPDGYRGFGFVVEDARKVTLRNLKVSGFRVGIAARRCRELVIEDCDVSENYRQRLHSTPDAEDQRDWLRPHENDRDEWMRYGAGIALVDCTAFTVRRCTGRRQQNGLCLTRCAAGSVYDCDFSFNSGWGVALYRSSGNVVCRNRLDWCIRGYSHGVYNRGQDSAGILLFEQCSRNVIALNSATHGGDGFFLYAGNETVERTGAGGSNRNLVWRNDFSHASNNGIEATFSRGNRFLGNVVRDGHYGFWGGFSIGSEVRGNDFEGCGTGVAIEHGSETAIAGNRFAGCGTAIRLWAREHSGFMDAAFGREHDCLSRRYALTDNDVAGAGEGIVIERTTEVSLTGNRVEARGRALLLGPGTGRVSIVGNELRGALENRSDGPVAAARNRFDPVPEGLEDDPAFRVARPAAPLPAPPAERELPGSLDPFLPAGARRGREFIIVDAWGPCDLAVPRAWPPRVIGGRAATVQLLGDGQAFALGPVVGDVVAEPLSGTLPQRLRIRARRPGVAPFEIPVRIDGGPALRVRGCLTSTDWTVAFRVWDRVGPRQPPADWAGVLRSEPRATVRSEGLDFSWGRRPHPRVPEDHFATVAESRLVTPAGRFGFRITSDDGVRVLVDGRVIHEDWTWHPPRTTEVRVALEAGEHALRVEHFEIDGFARLALAIEPVDG